MTEELFDFSQVAPATSSGYLEPGMYTVTPTEVKLEKPSGKNPYLSVTFSTKGGNIVRENFYLTPKAMGRLQYLHEAWFSRKLEKAFKTVDEIAAYFNKALLHKSAGYKSVIVGGTISNNGKVYGNLPYTNFLVPEGVAFEEGAFDVDSANYKNYVKKSNLTNAATMSDDSILPDADVSEISEDEDDAPWG